MKAVDINIVVNLFIKGTHSVAAGKLFSSDGHWILPDLWVHDMTNVVATYIKQSGMALDDGEKIGQKGAGIHRNIIVVKTKAKPKFIFYPLTAANKLKPTGQIHP